MFHQGWPQVEFLGGTPPQRLPRFAVICLFRTSLLPNGPRKPIAETPPPPARNGPAGAPLPGPPTPRTPIRPGCQHLRRRSRREPLWLDAARPVAVSFEAAFSFRYARLAGRPGPRMCWRRCRTRRGQGAERSSPNVAAMLTPALPTTGELSGPRKSRAFSSRCNALFFGTTLSVRHGMLLSPLNASGRLLKCMAVVLAIDWLECLAIKIQKTFWDVIKIEI